VFRDGGGVALAAMTPGPPSERITETGRGLMIRTARPLWLSAAIGASTFSVGCLLLLLGALRGGEYLLPFLIINLLWVVANLSKLAAWGRLDIADGMLHVRRGSLMPTDVRVDEITSVVVAQTARHLGSRTVRVFRRNGPSFDVGTGLGYDEPAMEWVADWIRKGIG